MTDFATIVQTSNYFLRIGQPVEAARLLIANIRAVRGAAVPAEMWINLNVAFRDTGHHKAAYYAASKAHEIAPSHPITRYHWAVAKMRIGELTSGAALYEARKDLGASVISAPEQFDWRGQELKHKRVLITLEQGYGDGFQFLRYAKYYASMGAKVTVGGPNDLMEITSQFQGIDSYVSGTVLLEDYDYVVPVMSGWGIIHGRGEGPWFGRYYTPLPADVRQAAEFMRRSCRPAIGIAIDGKSSPLKNNPDLVEPLVRLLETIDADIWLLDIDPHPSLRRKGMQAPPDVLHREHGRWVDVAAILGNLDYLLCVDTAIGHLAGAMGLPVALLLDFPGCWRWGPSGRSTDWYPAHSLYRRGRFQKWDTIVQQVYDDFRASLPRVRRSG